MMHQFYSDLRHGTSQGCVIEKKNNQVNFQKSSTVRTWTRQQEVSLTNVQILFQVAVTEVTTSFLKQQKKRLIIEPQPVIIMIF